MDENTRHKTMLGVGAGSVLAFYLGDRLGMLALRGDVLTQLLGPAWQDLLLDILLKPVAFSLNGTSLIIGIIFFTIVWAIYAYILNQQQNFRFGDEYGSARRGTVKEGQIYKDMSDRTNNIVLTKNLGIALRPSKGMKKKIANRNVCIIGGSGAGKTAGYVAPQILQLIDAVKQGKPGWDIVVVDPKGTLLPVYGMELVKNGIPVVLFNTVDKEKSDIYNPLANINSYDDINDFVNCLVKNTNNGKESSEPIWDNGEILFYRALITLLFDYFPNDLNLKNLLMLTDMCSIDESNPNAKSVLDRIFDQIRTGITIKPGQNQNSGKLGIRTPRKVVAPQTIPSDLRRRDGKRPAGWIDENGKMRRGFDVSQDEALKLWDEFKSGAAKTVKSFIISSHTRLAYISNPDVLKILGANNQPDNMHLELLGRDKDKEGNKLPPRVIFVTTSDFNENLNALLSIFMWQAIFLPMNTADNDYRGALPRPVRLIFDEFRNIGKLASFVQTIAVVRSRNIDVSIIVQSLAQIEDVYGKEGAATIRENCPTTMYLGGGRGWTSAKQISEEIGKETAIKTDWSRQGTGLGATPTRSRNSIQRDVYDPHEIATLSDQNAIVLIGDQEAIEDKKSWCFNHPCYDTKYMSENSEYFFDYVAWRTAGRPLGAAAYEWENKYWSKYK